LFGKKIRLKGVRWCSLLSIVIDAAEVVKALRIISRFDPQAVVEVRLLPQKKSDRIFAGYFDYGSFEKVPALLEPILKLRKHNAYITMNKIHPGLVARYHCRFEQAPEKTTTDSEVLDYRWLLVDCDPARPSGINATNEEFRFAVSRAEMVKQYCIDTLGLPEPVECESGNGYHLLFPINLPAAKANVETIKNALKRLAKEFDSAECKIDETVFNPARITKLYGTLAGKGDGTQDRPARMSRMVRIPEGLHAG